VPDSISHVAALSDGGALLCVDSDDNKSVTNVSILRLSSAGDVLWERLVAKDASCRTALPAGKGMAIAARAINLKTETEVRVLRTDAWGNTGCTASGACVDKAFSQCTDGKSCTLDSCSGAAGCIHVDSAFVCADGSKCSLESVCKKGACESIKNVKCDDSKDCTVDACDKQKGCRHTPAEDGAACADGTDACKVLTTCKAGSCVGGSDALWGWAYKNVERQTAMDAVFTTAGGVVAALWADHQGWNTGRLVLRGLDAAGTQGWQLAHPVKPAEPGGLAARGDGGVVAAGRIVDATKSRGTLMAADKAGKLAWERRFGQHSSSLADVAALGSGLVAAGYTIGGIAAKHKALGDHDGWLVRTDAAGIPQWDRVYGGKGTDRVAAIGISGGQTIAVGLTVAAERQQGWIFRVDGAGNLQWQTHIADPLAASAELRGIAVDAGGQSFVVGNWSPSSGGYRAFTARVDSAGKLRWKRDFSDAGRILSAVLATDNGFAAVGWTPAQGAKPGVLDARLLHMDADGRVLRDTAMHTAAHAAFYGLDQAGSALVVAGFKGAADPTKHDALVTRLDLFGNHSCAESGGCAGKAVKDCDDGSRCTTDGCLKGKCVNNAHKDGSACDGKHACEGGTCFGGKCATIKPRSCSDGNDCTVDSCNQATGCANAARHDGCDGLAWSGKCFKAFAQSATWTDAADRCKQWGGHLAKVVDPASRVVVNQRKLGACGAPAFAWLGLSGSKSGGWKWADGTKLGAFDSWNPGQPSAAGMSYVRIGPTGAWDNVAGHVRTSCYICERKLTATCAAGDACTPAKVCAAGTCMAAPASVCDDGNGCTADSCSAKTNCTHNAMNPGAACDDGDPCLGKGSCDTKSTCRPATLKACDDGKACTADGCKWGIGCTHATFAAKCDGKVIDGRCLRAFTGRFTWRSGRNACLGWGGDLPSVHSGAQNAAVRTAATGVCAGTDAIFLAGTDLHKEGDWRWQDGSAWDFEGWYDAVASNKQPDNSGSGEHAVMLGKDGTWYDTDLRGTLTSCLVCARSAVRPCTGAKCKAGTCDKGTCSDTDPAFWLKQHGGAHNDLAYGVAALSDGGVVTVGTTASKEFGVTAGMDAWAVRHNSDGKPAWTKLDKGTDPEYDGFQGALTLPGDVVMSCGWLGKSVEIGHVNWRAAADGKVIRAATAGGSKGLRFNGCGKAFSGSVAAGRSINNSGQTLGAVARYAADHKQVWLSSHNYGTQDVSFAAAEGRPDGKYVVAAGRYIRSADKKEAMIVALFHDANGAYGGHQAVHGPGTSLATDVHWLPGGDVMVAGRSQHIGDPSTKATLWRYNAALKLVWAKRPADLGLSISQTVLEKAGTIALVGASHKTSKGDYEPLFGRVDDSGKLLSKTIVSASKTAWFSALAPRPDGGFWAVGFTIDKVNKNQALLARLDGKGKASCP